MSEHKQHSKMAAWGLRITGLLVGVAIAWLVYLGGQVDMMSRLSGIYQKVGVTLIALMPLAFWAVYTAFRAGHNSDITLAYIGTTAQRVGLLGTVIGIVAATITIGDSLNAGAATAVTGALPAVGQALLSTAVGFVIAIVCDFFRYINVRGTAPEEV